LMRDEIYRLNQIIKDKDAQIASLNQHKPCRDQSTQTIKA